MSALTKLTDTIAAMFKTGPDGVEQGLATSEFWLAAFAEVVVVFGPQYGWLKAISPTEQLVAAGAIASIYQGFRTWRKNKGNTAFAITGLKAALSVAKVEAPRVEAAFPAQAPVVAAVAAAIPEVAAQ